MKSLLCISLLIFCTASHAQTADTTASYSLKLKGIEVTAQRRTTGSTTAYVIDRATLDHAQMVNLTGITSLLPGGKTVNATLMDDSRLALRSGTQEMGNAAFGTAIEVGGMRLDNNAMMDETLSASTRNISSANIGSVEVITGIASVEYGDVSNGIVRINPRHGLSPWIVEGAINPYTRQIALSKGIRHFNFSFEHANSFSNEPVNGGANAACYYLDRREVANAANHPEFMDFNQPYLQGLSRTVRIPYKEQGKLLVTTLTSSTYPEAIAGVYYTIGVHQRGCGLVFYDDPEYWSGKYIGRSSYNYVDQVAKKIKDVKQRDVTAEEIYSGTIDDDVKEAVEDLIIDEMALELAFEGSRFSDLCRASLHRGPQYLAERVAMRRGSEDSGLKAWLSNMNNWWLPIPEE